MSEPIYAYRKTWVQAWQLTKENQSDIVTVLNDLGMMDIRAGSNEGKPSILFRVPGGTLYDLKETCWVIRERGGRVHCHSDEMFKRVYTT